MTIWKGAWYYRKRGGSWRNRNTGAVIKGGMLKGQERTKQHYYSADSGRTLRKLKGGVSPRSLKTLRRR